MVTPDGSTLCLVPLRAHPVRAALVALVGPVQDHVPRMEMLLGLCGRFRSNPCVAGPLVGGCRLRGLLRFLWQGPKGVFCLHECMDRTLGLREQGVV
jgi:hypothetical protein